MTTAPPDLSALADRLTAGAELRPADREWLADTVARLAAGEAVRPPAAAIARAARDRLLRGLWREHYAHLKPRPAAERIAEDLARYAATGWRHDRHRAACPYPASSAKATQWHILATGQRIIAWRALLDVLEFVQSDAGETAQVRCDTVGMDINESTPTP